MKQYLSFFRIRFTAGLQYRAAAWGGICTQFFWGFMTLLMYRAFYRSNAQAFPMTYPQLASYIWLQQSTLALFQYWFYDPEIFEHITSGSVAYELCRPCDLYAMWFIKNMARRLSQAMLRFLPVVTVAALLPAPFGISLPASPAAAGMFLLSLFLGFLVMIALHMLVYISVMYTLSANGMRILVSSVLEFLCGGVIPLPFFPQWLQPIMYALPFASMQTTPFLIYVGHLTVQEGLRAMGMQLLWLAALLWIGHGLMSRALRKVVVQGG